MASENVYHKTHRRINELHRLDFVYSGSTEDEKISEMVRDGDFAARWELPLDYALAEGDSGYDEELDNTLNITGNRLLILGPNRKVPAVFLPSYISYIDAVVTGELVSDTEFEVDGEAVTPDMDKVYFDTATTEYYRWVESDGNTSKFYPIPNAYQMVDGDGTTLVVNSGADHSRQIDLNVGSPADPYDASTADAPLEIYNEQLIHRTISNYVPVYVSLVGPGINQTPQFTGDEFRIPHFSVTQTGHVYDNSSATCTVMMPRTAATTSVQGLVKIGTSATKVSSSSLPGTTSGSGYLLVSAADHTHSADKITFTFGRGQDIVYDMSADKTVDFSDILLAKLPSNDPSQLSGDPVVLGVNSTGSGNASTTAWKTAMSAMQPAGADIPAVTDYDMSGATQTATQLVQVTGLAADGVYLVSANITVAYTSTDGEIRNFSIIAKSNSTEICRRSFTVEGQRSSGQGKYVLDMMGVTGGSDLSLWLSVDSGEFPASANYKLSVSGSRVTRLR